MAQSQATAPGSLIQPDAYRGLTADRRAHALGDMLTVVVVETAHASVSANTDGSHDLKLSAQARTPRGTYPYGFGMGGSDQGEGLTSRAGTLQAQLAVRVTEVGPDGLLHVRGEQSVIINGEQQRIALSGLVREEDILASNLIPSNRIGDAQIEFTGQGDVSEAQRHGAIYRFMKWLRLL
ncbi:flagellar basal body L-ring protein FlgH [Rhodanobacter sp. KK11]|uniref:flagellar basal body L-ring protein FlgH n=1 Tax=Rhodanobacter sp. KK11 TaxID=3083255 RepID=UPI0029670856|nr:flagellar basal body L-ring protein FlgH [Rhodanobacter sp. KK11]MDW2981777.1 flagellar basal body L-ring protein FlgH [Rhodanobacter sp. KK11]